MPAGPKSITEPVTSTAGEATHNPKSGTEIVETTSQRKTRPKFVRQKSFEIDSDSTDTSLADISNIVSEVRIDCLRLRVIVNIKRLNINLRTFYESKI